MDFVVSEILPVIKRHAIAGRAHIRTFPAFLLLLLFLFLKKISVTLISENAACEHPLFIDIALDILSERGYFVFFDSKEIFCPDSLDPKTYKILMTRFPPPPLFIYLFIYLFICLFVCFCYSLALTLFSYSFSFSFSKRVFFFHVHFQRHHLRQVDTASWM